jgi:hypothetical protein
MSCVRRLSVFGTIRRSLRKSNPSSSLSLESCPNRAIAQRSSSEGRSLLAYKIALIRVRESIAKMFILDLIWVLIWSRFSSSLNYISFLILS